MERSVSPTNFQTRFPAKRESPQKKMSLHIFAPFFSRSNPSIVGITANSGAANRNRFDTRPKTPLHSLSKYSWIDHISLSRKKISAKYNLPSNRAKLEPPVFERSERSRMIFDDRDQTQRTATGKESKNRRERSRDLTIVSTTTRGDERRRRREREREGTPRSSYSSLSPLSSLSSLSLCILLAGRASCVGTKGPLE